MMEAIFWISVLVLFYTYFGYPLYVFLRAKVAWNNINKDMSYKPFVSIIMSAYNEETSIGKKIVNLLICAYPKDKMEILVGSDGSEDGTKEVLSGISDDRVKVFIFPKRRGKPAVLNDLVRKAKGEILIFCDVRQLFDQAAISHLVANFADEKVGCASGELIFGNGSDSNHVSEGVGVYWNYEKLIRRSESEIHSMIGATGAIYAVRKKLYTVFPKDTILDDVYTPLSIVRQGYRSILDIKARAYDRPASAPKEEYRRKVRTLAGNYQIFAMFKDLFIPFKSPVAMPLFSHKLLRVLAPFFMISLFITNIFIAKKDFYAAFLVIQVLFYILALMGGITYKNKSKELFTKAASVAYMFCLMNFTAMVGLYRFIAGRQNIAWEK